jgi:hypothetical protein
MRNVNRFICAHPCHLWILLLLGPVARADPQAPDPPGHRLALGAGTVLLVPDSVTGLTLWATRETRPGRSPSPDFVGWLDPEAAAGWAAQSRLLLGGVSPPEGEAVEGPRLSAVDRGYLTLLRFGDPVERSYAFAFGHPEEQQRWLIEATAGEVQQLLDTLAALAGLSHLRPVEGVGYANPTHRRITPDREQGPVPALSGEPGEIWARLELDRSGAALPRSGRILWGSTEQGKAVLKVLPGYRYRRKDGGKPERLVVYQRFRVRRLGG